MAEEQSDGIPSYLSNLFSILDGFQKNSQMEYFTVFWMDGWHDFSNCDGPTISAAVKFPKPAAGIISCPTDMAPIVPYQSSFSLNWQQNMFFHYLSRKLNINNSVNLISRVNRTKLLITVCLQWRGII